MKNLVETLNEAIAIKNVSFDLKNDIYNAMAHIGYEYTRKGKTFDKETVKDVLYLFMDKFFDED